MSTCQDFRHVAKKEGVIISNITDEIVIKAQNGDIEATEYILNKCRGYIWKQVGKYYIHGGDYQDIFQEGLIGLWTAIKKYKPIGVPFINFAHIFIKNYICELIRRDNAKKQEVLNNATQINDFEIVNNINTEEIVITKENVKDILQSLTDVEYNVSMLTSSGFNVSEIANRLNISKNCVRHARFRVRKKIKKVVNA